MFRRVGRKQRDSVHRLVVLPEVDLSMVRAALGASANLALVVGLVWDIE